MSDPNTNQVNHRPHPHPHPHPGPKGPLPVKKVVLTREFRNTLYELAVRTNTDAVFDNEYKYTLGEMLTDISNALITNFRRINEVSEAFNKLMADCPEEFATLKEIADYINVDGDPKSALIELIDSKVDIEEGKGLSSNDFTDILREKLENDYTKEELDEIIAAHNQKFNDLELRVNTIEEKNNIEISDEPGEEVKDNDVWFRLHSEYVPENEGDVIDPDNP